MLQYKHWLHDDHLANHAEYLAIPKYPEASWTDYVPVIWAGLLILFGTAVWKLRRIAGQ